MATEHGTVSPTPTSTKCELESTISSAANHARVRSTLQNVVLIASVTLCMVVNVANLIGVSISLPTIGRDLNIVEYKLQWIMNAYALSSGCMLLFFGRLADLYGRKRAFLCGCAWLGIFALACGFAQDEITLDVLRAIQGLGAAAAIPASLGILAHAFPPSTIRSVAFATFASGAPVGGVFGCTVGGVLTQLTEKSWRSMFWFVAGLAAVCCVGGALSIDKDEPYELEDRRLDWLGAFIGTTALTFILFALSDGNVAPDGWKTGYVIALLIVGVLLLAVFILWERYLEDIHSNAGTQQHWWTPPPLMSVSIYGRANGKLGVMLLVAFLQYCGFWSLFFWIVLYYQSYAELSPIATMVRLLPMPITGFICTVIVGLVVNRVDVVILIAIGTTLTAVGSLLFAVIDPAAPYWAFGFPASILAVFGSDCVFAAGTLFVAKVCLPHEQSVGGAIFNTLMQVGSALGTALSTIVFNATLTKSSRADGVAVNKSGTNAPRPAQLVAYKDAFWTSFAFLVCATVLAVLFLRGVGVVGHVSAPQEDAESDITADAAASGKPEH